MTEGAIKTATHRLRARFRDALRAAVADTVDADTDVDAEIAELFAALRPTYRSSDGTDGSA